MQTIIKYTVLMVLGLYVTKSNAQDTIQGQKTSKTPLTETQLKSEKILELEQLISKIEIEERELLKSEVEAINQRIDAKTITYEEGDVLKQNVAKKRALNIKNRVAILENKISFYERNNLEYNEHGNRIKGKLGIIIGEDDNFPGLSFSNNKKKPVKYDIRTGNELLFAMGINNAIIDGQNLNDSPYKIGGSGFVELGWNWETRLLKESNLVRVKYGFSFQWNKYEIKDNKYFVQDGNATTLETFSADLKQAEFRNTNLVFPLYFEFGGWEKIEKEDRIRFNTYDKFKIGFGAYGGFNLGAQQKLRYKDDGNRVKEKMKQDYNVNNFVYGVGAYVGVGDMSLYAKYDLSETFKDQAVKQNNISLGLRWDLD